MDFILKHVGTRLSHRMGPGTFSVSEQKEPRDGPEPETHSIIFESFGTGVDRYAHQGYIRPIKLCRTRL